MVDSGGRRRSRTATSRSIRLANGARATARSSSRQQLRKVQESNPDAFARHPVFGTGVCTTQTSPSRNQCSRRESNPHLRIESAPSSATGPRELGTSGWIRTSAPSFGSSGHVHVRRREGRDVEAKLVRESNPAIRFRRPESDPSTEPTRLLSSSYAV